MLNKLKIVPIFLLAGINAIESDCRKIMALLYPEAGVCNREYEMTCYSDFACYIDEEYLEDPCNAYSCLMESRCPEGTTYLPYFPPHSGDQSSAGSISTESGYACYPNDKLPDQIFQCNFDSTDNYRLNVDAVVPDINRNYAYDNRTITLISWEKYQAYPEDQHAMFDLFELSQCKGELIDGHVYFNGIKSEVGGCEFTNLGIETDTIGVPVYTQKFVIGYDDLVDLFGDMMVVKRYGKKYIVNCHIRASDTEWKDPAEDDRHNPDDPTCNEERFELNMYSDPKFEIPQSTESSCQSSVIKSLYIEAKVTADGPADNWILHLKQCSAKTSIRNRIDVDNADDHWSDWEMTTNEQIFLIDGVLAMNDSTSEVVHIKDTRVEWSDKLSETTLNEPIPLTNFK